MVIDSRIVKQPFDNSHVLEPRFKVYEVGKSWNSTIFKKNVECHSIVIFQVVLTIHARFSKSTWEAHGDILTKFSIACCKREQKSRDQNNAKQNYSRYAAVLLNRSTVDRKLEKYIVF